MKKQPWFWCLAGLLLLCIGVLVGKMIPWERPPSTVAAFAPLSTPEIGFAGEYLPTQSLTPASTGENWFLLETVAPSQAPEISSATATPMGSLPGDTPTPSQDTGFMLELVRDTQEEQRQSPQGGMRVLIYHTHTYEAYEQTEANPYQETQQWRTQDAAHNIVQVGEVLASLLRSMGVQVVHDMTAFEPPDLNTSYTRSLGMLETRKAMGESYDLYIDLHRDAYVKSQPGPNVVTVGDENIARLMMLIGKGEGQTTEGFEEKPAWQDNLSIAQKITDGLNQQVEGLGKEVRMKSGRFNQHIAVGCVLVEVGNNMNTLEEALAAMPYLADAIHGVLAQGK